MVIYNPIDLREENDIGILVREVYTSSFEKYDFFHFACPQFWLPKMELQPYYTWVKWKQAIGHEKDGLGLSYGYTDAIAPRRIHLFAFGETRLLNFPLSDLNFSVKILGCVWIIDSSELFGEHTDPGFFDKLKNAGAIVWARKQGLTFLLAVTKCNASHTSVDTIRGIFALEQEIPIILCPEGLDTEKVHLTLSVLAQRILAL